MIDRTRSVAADSTDLLERDARFAREDRPDDPPAHAPIFPGRADRITAPVVHLLSAENPRPPGRTESSRPPHADPGILGRNAQAWTTRPASEPSPPDRRGIVGRESP